MADAGQESVYVVLDLDGAGTMPAPGTQLLLQGMTTAQPTLQLADGTRLVGAFEETVGTQLILADAIQPDGSHSVRLVGHTDKRINFSKVAASSAEPAEAAAAAMEVDTADGAAAAAAATDQAAGREGRPGAAGRAGENSDAAAAAGAECANAQQQQHGAIS